MKKIYTNVPNFEPIELVEYYDEFSWYYPDCEMQTKKWCVKNIKDNWTILDCGANIGYYSILFSKLSPNGKIYAFEPTDTYEKLQTNIKYNHCDNIKTIKMAVGEKSGEFSDNIYKIWGNEPERLKFQFITLDDFVIQNNLKTVDLIKIDVDSFDFEVLKGATKTMKKFNPWLIVELNHALSKRAQSNMQALEWLIEQGYKISIVKDQDNFIMKRDMKVDTLKKIELYF